MRLFRRMAGALGLLRLMFLDAFLAMTPALYRGIPVPRLRQFCPAKHKPVVLAGAK